MFRKRLRLQRISVISAGVVKNPIAPACRYLHWLLQQLFGGGTRRVPSFERTRHWTSNPPIARRSSPAAAAQETPVVNGSSAPWTRDTTSIAANKIQLPAIAEESLETLFGKALRLE